MQAWQTFLKELEVELGHETVDSWLRALKLLHYDACNLYLEARDAFQILWFEEHIRAKATLSFRNNNNRPIKVHLSLPGANDEKKDPRKRVRGEKSEKEEKGKRPVAFKFFEDQVDVHSSFATFIPFEGNMLAYKALAEIAGYDVEQRKEIPPQVELAGFNPIYLYGASGVGKTHLLAATYQLMKKRGLKVSYCRSETFIDQIINAMRSASLSQFRKRYRKVDVLILDDVHHFSRKNACQEELFHTFNTLHQEGRQIILSSEVYPQELPFVEPRLISRFEWGITIPLLSVSSKEYLQLAKHKAQVLDFPLDNPVISFLCEAFSRNSKVLCRSIEALALRTHLQKDERNMASSLQLDVPRVKVLLEDLLEEEEHAVLTPSKIIKIVAGFYGVPVNDVLGKSQSRECALPRQVAMHLCRTLLDISYMKIGDLFSRNHSTVMSSIRQIQKSLSLKDPNLCQSLQQIHRSLKLQETPF